MGAGRIIAITIWDVRRKAGLPPGLHPLEIEMGMTFEEWTQNYLDEHGLDEMPQPVR